MGGHVGPRLKAYSFSAKRAKAQALGRLRRGETGRSAGPRAGPSQPTISTETESAAHSANRRRSARREPARTLSLRSSVSNLEVARLPAVPIALKTPCRVKSDAGAALWTAVVPRCARLARSLRRAEVAFGRGAKRGRVRHSHNFAGNAARGYAPPSAGRQTGMPSLRALSARLSWMPPPGKTTTPTGIVSSIVSLRLKGADLRE